MTKEREAKQITPSVPFFLQVFPSRKTPSNAHFSSVKNLDAARRQRPAPSYAAAASCSVVTMSPKPMDRSKPCTAVDNSSVDTSMRSAIEANSCCS